MQLRHWWATSAEASDHNSRRQLVDANDQEQSFHLGFSSAHGDDPPVWGEDVISEHCKRLLVIGYRSRLPARCPKLTLVDGRCHRLWETMHRKSDLGHWMYCVFSDEFCFMLFRIDGRDCAHCRQGERLIGACIQSTNTNYCPSVLAWGATTMVEGVNCWYLMDPSTTNVTSGFFAIACFT